LNLLQFCRKIHLFISVGYSKAAAQMEPRAIAAQERLKTLLRPTPLPELPVAALPEQAIAGFCRKNFEKSRFTFLLSK
jgi:hypothetical protein